MNKESNPLWATAGLLLMLCAITAPLICCDPVLAADLVVPYGGQVVLSPGSHAYSKALISGELILQGDTAITLTYCKDNPDQCSGSGPVLSIKAGGKIRCDVQDGEDGLNAQNYGESGGNGGNGQNGYNLTMVVHGDASINDNQTGYSDPEIDLRGSAGGDGGYGADGEWGRNACCRPGCAEAYPALPATPGGNGGNGGYGGNGGNLNLTVYGNLITRYTVFYVSGGDAGSGGSAGHGRTGGRGCKSNSSEFDDFFLGQGPSVPGTPGNTYRPGRSGSVVIHANTVIGDDTGGFSIAAKPGRHGGLGKGGNGGGVRIEFNEDWVPTAGGRGARGHEGLSGGTVFVQASCEATNLKIFAEGDNGGGEGSAGSAGGYDCPFYDAPLRNGLDGLIPLGAFPGGTGGSISITSNTFMGRVYANGGSGGTSSAGASGGGCNGGKRGTAFPGANGASGGAGGNVRVMASTILPGTVVEVDGGGGGGGGSGACCNWDDENGWVNSPKGSPGPDGASGIYQKTLASAQALRTLTAVDKSQALAGDAIEYAVSVSAASPHTNVALTFPIPAGITITEVSGEHTQSNGVIRWTVPALAACKFSVFTVKALITGLPGEVITASASAASTQQTVPQSSNVVETLILIDDPISPVFTILPESLYGPQPDDVIDPVNPATGNFTFSNALFGYVGKGVPFGFVVNYNALDSAADGPLGFGWTHSYNIFLSRSGNDVTISWGDGHKEFFKDMGGGVFEAFNCRPSVSLAILGAQGYEATARSGLKYRFDDAGRLSSLTDRNGNQITLSHSTFLDSITDTAGREITFIYDGSRISQVSGPLITWMFDYDANGDLTGITDPRGNTRYFTYDTAHRMLTDVDPCGNTVASNIYDSDGRVVSQTNAVGGQTTFEYTAGASGTTVKITPPSGNAVWQVFDTSYNLILPVDGNGAQSSFSFDNNGLPVRIADKNGRAITCSYDPSGNLISLTNRRGNKTRFRMGVNNQPTRQTDALGQASEFTYDPAGNMTAWKDTLGKQSSASYDSSGQFLSMQDPRGATWQADYTAEGLMAHRSNPAGSTVAYSYDAAGRPVVITLPDGNTWQMTYDPNGNLASQTDPLGHVVTLEYDANNNVIRRTFVPTGAVTEHAYDAMNRLVMTTDALGGKTTYAYDIEGRLVSATDPDGVTTGYQYDKSGRVTLMTDAAGGTTSYGYDALGNVVSIQDPLGKTWTSAFNEENQVVQSTDPLGHSSSYTYDELERVETITDKLGNVTTLSYDAESRLVKVTHPDGSAAAYQYDANGNMTKVTDGLNHAWQFAFDAVNRLTAATDPVGRQETFRYDAFNRVTRKVTRKGETITYAYNAAGGLVSVTLPGPTPITYGYDAAGNLTAITDPSGTTSMTYDLLGRRITRTDPNGKTLAFSYTAAGRLKTIRYPGNHDVTYAYDTAGRLATITDWLGHQTHFQYDIASRPTRIDLPNGTRKLFTYDDRGLVATLTEEKSDATTIAGYSFLRNAGGRITGETRNEAVTGTFISSQSTYTYDAANRMLTAVKNGVSTAYAYDFNGNLASRTSGGITTAYTYDTLNRLIQVRDGANTTAYAYDGAGNRLAKTYNGAKTQYLREGGQVFCTLDGAGSVKSYNIFAGILLYSLDAAGKMAVYHDDVRGSVSAITDAAQGIVRAYAYDPYGNVIGSSGTPAGDVRFVGTHGVLADENGLYHMQARYYDPETRRFITEDPIGLSGGLNLYGYVGSDPINRIDPTGLKPPFEFVIDLSKPSGGGSLPAPNPVPVEAAPVVVAPSATATATAAEEAEAVRIWLYQGQELFGRDAAGGIFMDEPVIINGIKVNDKMVANYLKEYTPEEFLEFTKRDIAKERLLCKTVPKQTATALEATGASTAESSPGLLGRAWRWGSDIIKPVTEHPVGRGVIRYGTAVIENPVTKGIIRFGGTVLVVYVVVDTGVRSYFYGREHASKDLYYDNMSGRWVTFDQYYTEGYLPIFQWYYQVDPMDQLNPSFMWKVKFRKEHPELYERLKNR